MDSRASQRTANKARVSRARVAKRALAAMPKARKRAWWVIVIAAPALVIFMLAWSFSLHGTWGLLKWTPPLVVAFVIVAILGVVAPVVSVVELFMKDWSGGRSYAPRRAVWAFGIASIVTSAGFLGYFGGAPFVRVGDKPPQLLVADGVGAHGIPDLAVTFWTRQSTRNTLHYGAESPATPAVANLSRSAAEETPRQQHAFMLTDLLPETRYYYQINQEGPVYNFTTPPAESDALRFAVGGDPHVGRAASRTDVTRELLAIVADDAHGYDFFSILGDLTDLGWLDSHWQQLLEVTSPTSTHVPFRPLLGNHDTFFGGARLYQEYLYPAPMARANGSRLWYRFDIHDVHFLVLDLEWGTETYTPAQAAWLEAQLASIPRADWTVVMTHCMFYSSGIRFSGIPWWDIQEMIQTFAPLFVTHDVDLVFSGHNHHVEFINESGVLYTVAGSLGGVPDGPREVASANSLWYQTIDNADEFAFCDVTIAGDVATVSFRNRHDAVLHAVQVTR